MPDLFKVGMTTKKEISQRLNELYTVGVPHPFVCEFAGKFKDASKMEKLLHKFFNSSRINSKREFFNFVLEDTLPLLKEITEEDVTPELRKKAEAIDKEGRESYERKIPRRPTLNYVEMNIPRGSLLKFKNNEEITVKVDSERMVIFEDEKTYLTTVTKGLLKLDRNVAPAAYWTHEGRSLKEIYEETYIKNPE